MKVTKGIHRPRLLITGGPMARNQGPHLARAVIYQMEHLPVHTLNVSSLFAESARSPEETCVQVSTFILIFLLKLILKEIISMYIIFRSLMKQVETYRP